MAQLVFCEDEPRTRKLIRAMLMHTSHEVYLAINGAEGLILVEQVMPDLVFLDISMPICDGFQMADEMKLRPHLSHIPIVFLSAFAQQSDKDEAFRYHGASDYLTKPFDLADLLMVIKRFVSPYHATTIDVADYSQLQKAPLMH